MERKFGTLQGVFKVVCVACSTADHQKRADEWFSSSTTTFTPDEAHSYSILKDCNRIIPPPSPLQISYSSYFHFALIF